MGTTTATEMDATNAKGWYSFVLTQGETNADALLFTAKSSTANISIVGALIFSTPNRFSSMVIDAAGLADANTVKLGPTGSGTAQTARDIGASVLLSSGTGTGQLSFTSGILKVDVDTIKTNPVVNAGTITFPTTATLASTTNITAGTIATVTNLTNAPTAGDLTATMKTSVTTAATAATPIAASVTGAVGSVTGNVGGNVVGSVASVTARVTANTDQFNGDGTSAANIAKTTRAIGRATVSGSPSTTSIPTSACTPAGAVADQFKGRIITFDADTTSTALRGQATDITASSNSATPTFTVTALTTAPAVGDTFSIT